jgi:hypothetical protein
VVPWAASATLFILMAASAPLATGTTMGAAPTPTRSFAPTPRSIPSVIAAVLAARRGAPIPTSLVPPLERLVTDQYPPIPDCWALRGDPRGIDTCTLFRGGARGTIVLIGDSHARSWLPAISWMAKRDGWAVVPLWRRGCWPASYHAGRDCQSFVEWAERRVRALRPDVVLIGGAFRFETVNSIRRTAEGITWLTAAIGSHARHVMVIGDAPSLVFQPAHCLGARGARLSTCTRTLSASQIAAYRAAQRATTVGGALFLDTVGWFCFDRQCPAVVGHTVAYRVRDHISRTYATEIRGLFRTAFRRTLAQMTGTHTTG